MSPQAALFSASFGHLPKPATNFKENYMDYLIAGLASAGLFVYLIYALLKPERF
jgi:K+-transporting ATPase KdpF subunit